MSTGYRAPRDRNDQPIDSDAGCAEPEPTWQITWLFKDRPALSARLADRKQGEECIHEWAMFRRGLNKTRIKNNDHLIGGDGWAYDMNEIVGVYITPAKDSPPVPASDYICPCAVAAFVFFMVSVVLTIALIWKW